MKLFSTCQVGRKICSLVLPSRFPGTLAPNVVLPAFCELEVRCSLSPSREGDPLRVFVSCFSLPWAVHPGVTCPAYRLTKAGQGQLHVWLPGQGQRVSVQVFALGGLAELPAQPRAPGAQPKRGLGSCSLCVSSPSGGFVVLRRAGPGRSCLQVQMSPSLRPSFYQ